MKRTRHAVGKVDLEHGIRIGKSQWDKYDAIVERLGQMADKEETRAGRNAKIEQFIACALMGFGLHKGVLGNGGVWH